jgi:hypothetical protein
MICMRIFVRICKCGSSPSRFSISPSSDGSFFIDRSPKWFRCVLDYLRAHSLSVDLHELSASERAELRTECQFYGIASLLEMMGMVCGNGNCVFVSRMCL